MGRPHFENGDTITRLDNGDFEVKAPDGVTKGVYAIHPERLPPPRIGFSETLKASYGKDKGTIQQAMDAWRAAESQAEGARRIISRYFIGNEKWRAKEITIKQGASTSSMDSLSIPLDVLFGDEGWVNRLLAYATQCDHAADEARWEFVAAVHRMMPDFHPDLRPGEKSTRVVDRLDVTTRHIDVEGGAA